MFSSSRPPATTGKSSGHNRRRLMASSRPSQTSSAMLNRAGWPSRLRLRGASRTARSDGRGVGARRASPCARLVRDGGGVGARKRLHRHGAWSFAADLDLLEAHAHALGRFAAAKVAHMEEDVARPLGRGDEAEAARGIPADDLALSGHRWCGVFLRKKAIQRLIGKRKQLLF